MTASPDISALAAPDLIALKAVIDARLEQIKQRHVEEGAALGLKYVLDGEAPPKRKRRNVHKEPEPKEANGD